MKILVIEEWSDATNVFIHELHAGTGCSIEHAGSFDEGLLKIEQRHGGIDIVLYAIPPTSSDTLVFPERIRAMAADALFRCPHLILLTSSPLALPCAVKCMDRQVVYLLREYPNQIVEIVRALLWKIRSSKPGPTIRVEFRREHYRFFICGITASEEIVVSRQIGRLLLLMLRGTHTVDVVAEELDVLPKTVKKYMRALRLIIESLLEQMNMAEPNADVVWMKRGPGGTLCGLRANPVWP
jgi:hypothetical protein